MVIAVIIFLLNKLLYLTAFELQTQELLCLGLLLHTYFNHLVESPCNSNIVDLRIQ